jgi:hypothetical protein
VQGRGKEGEKPRQPKNYNSKKNLKQIKHNNYHRKSNQNLNPIKQSSG